VSVRTRVCVEVGCDGGCTNPFADFDWTPHFESVGQARAELAGWRWNDVDGTVLCPGCSAAADCARDGHRWGEWLECRCGGRISGHGPDGCPRYRICGRCGDGDWPQEPCAARSGQADGTGR
jgi:hypothetical protein